MSLYSLPESKAFLVSLKAVILNENREVLLLKVREDDISVHDRGKWNLPGGLMEFGESFDETLVREVKEETGLDVGIDELIGLSDYTHESFQFENGNVKDVQVILIGYVCTAREINVSIDEEHALSEWVSVSELPGRKFTANSHDLIQIFLADSSVQS